MSEQNITCIQVRLTPRNDWDVYPPKEPTVIHISTKMSVARGRDILKSLHTDERLPHECCIAEIFADIQSKTYISLYNTKCIMDRPNYVECRERPFMDIEINIGKKLSKCKCASCLSRFQSGKCTDPVMSKLGALILPDKYKKQK